MVTCARRKSHLGQAHRGELDLLVLEQAAHQLGARVLGLGAALLALGRQQHARLDLDEHGRHEQVFGGQLQVAAADLVHVAQVLARDIHHGDVEDVEVLLADQVEQQVQRPLEGLQEDLQRVRRDVQVLRQREQRLAVEARQRHLVHHLGHGRFVLRGRCHAFAMGSIAGCACWTGAGGYFG
jgi:hypothetical protein